MTDRNRIVIVGAGYNALGCTCYLAKASHDITVFERRSGVGGAVNTEKMWWDPGEAHRGTQGIGGNSKLDSTC